MTAPLDVWVDELSAALEVDASSVDRDLILDLAREAAHGVARPAAPLTTFLVGLAAGRAGGSAEAIREAAQTALRAAQHHRAGNTERATTEPGTTERTAHD